MLGARGASPEGLGHERWLEEQGTGSLSAVGGFSGGGVASRRQVEQGTRERGVKAETWTPGWNQEQEDWVGTCGRDETGTTAGDAGCKTGRDPETIAQPVLAGRIQSLGRGA